MDESNKRAVKARRLSLPNHRASIDVTSAVREMPTADSHDLDEKTAKSQVPRLSGTGSANWAVSQSRTAAALDVSRLSPNAVINANRHTFADVRASYPWAWRRTSGDGGRLTCKIGSAS